MKHVVGVTLASLILALILATPAAAAPNQNASHVASCATNMGGGHVAQCAQNMDQGVSRCARM